MPGTHDNAQFGTMQLFQHAEEKIDLRLSPEPEIMPLKLFKLFSIRTRYRRRGESLSASYALEKKWPGPSPDLA